MDVASGSDADSCAGVLGALSVIKKNNVTMISAPENLQTI
jgi:hypothetical protein